MKVKICGVQCFGNALAAVDAGADMLGFNFYPYSPRAIRPAASAEIIARLRQQDLRVVTVGIFVNETQETIREMMRRCGLDLAQLSGDEPPALLHALGDIAIKALRPQRLADARSCLAAFAPFSTTPAFVIDAFRPGKYGGTGQPGDWKMARQLATEYPLMLAGGLTPNNVEYAVAQVRPWGVDVASGIESAPGIQDRDKIRAFIQAAKAAAEASTSNSQHTDE